MAKKIVGVSGIEEVLGEHLGYGPPVLVDQARIDQFAEATGDHQWIHVDPVAAAAGPFGATIAHGMLTVSMGVDLVAGLYELEGFEMVVNKGLNRVRFMNPVPVNSSIYGGVCFKQTKSTDKGTELVIEIDIKDADGDNLVCVAEFVILLMG